MPEFIINNNDTNHLNYIKDIDRDINRMVIFSPFLSSEIDTILREFTSLEKIELFTNLDGFRVADTIIKSVARLYKYCNDNNIELVIKYNNSLHGKAYLLYNNNTEKGFIITSANFTENGLKNNLEFGVFISDIKSQQEFYNSVTSMPFSPINSSDIDTLLQKVKEYEKNKPAKIQDVFVANKYLKQHNYKISIDNTKIKEKIIEYKKIFSSRFSTQKYLWEAVKTFQSSWDWNASDFSGMYKKATKDAENLLNTTGFLPRNYVIKHSQNYSSNFYNMFKNLYNESTPLDNRIDLFINQIETYDGKSYHEDIIAISTYLWLMYPSQYYFYKYSIAYEVAKSLGVQSLKRTSTHIEKMLWSFELYDGIREHIMNDNELLSVVKKELDDNNYTDSEYHCLTIDFCFFVRPLYANRNDKTKIN